MSRSSNTLGAVAALTALLLVAAAEAQLPVATGRQIALSRPQWKLFIPSDYEPRPGGEVDLLVHFHGDSQTVWNNAAHAELNAAIVTVNYNGLSSAYRGPFSDDTLFQTLLDDARQKLAAQPDFGPTTAWDRLGVSSFSAGYGAVREILNVGDYYNAIDGILAADSLYATTASDGTALDSQMARYKSFAGLASVGLKRFTFTHSQVQTFTYESTAETGDELLDHLNLPATPTNERGLGPLRYYREASRGGFRLRGAVGAAGEDHLNHLRYMGEWLDDLGLDSHRLDGDTNGDGAVDAADYTGWRDLHPYSVPSDGYDVWRANFGTDSSQTAEAVPEPSTLAPVALAAFCGSRRTRRAQR